jgi:hypothetical protein
MRRVARRGFRRLWWHSRNCLLVVLVTSAVLSGSHPAAGDSSGGRKIMLLRGTVRQEVHFPSQPEFPAPTPLPPVVERPLAEINILRALPVPLPELASAVSETAAEFEPESVTEPVEREPANDAASPDEAESLPAVPAISAQWPAAPRVLVLQYPPVVPEAPISQQAAPRNEYSALEIVSLSVGISFGLSLLVIRMVLVAARPSSTKAGMVPQHEPPGQDARRIRPVPVRNTGPSALPDRQQNRVRRTTRVVDLAHDPLTLDPIAAAYLQQQLDQQKLRNDQQTAILERIHQENVALQHAHRRPAPAAVPSVSC